MAVTTEVQIPVWAFQGHTVWPDVVVRYPCCSKKKAYAWAHEHDSVSERLRRWTRNPLGSARRGSNPLAVDFVHCHYSLLYKLTWVGCVEKPTVASYPKIVGSSPTVAPHCTAHLEGS